MCVCMYVSSLSQVRESTSKTMIFFTANFSFIYSFVIPDRHLLVLVYLIKKKEKIFAIKMECWAFVYQSNKNYFSVHEQHKPVV